MLTMDVLPVMWLGKRHQFYMHKDHVITSGENQGELNGPVSLDTYTKSPLCPGGRKHALINSVSWKCFKQQDALEASGS